MSRELERLIAAMSDPRMYPHSLDAVQVIQTHISVVFIAGDLVYKIKKPVNFGFLDFSTLDKRKYFCHEEVRLNARFSSGVYLGVTAIHKGPSGINIEGVGQEIEAAVLMKRIPENATLLSMLNRDLVTPEILDRIAERIAYFHSGAAGGPEISSYAALGVIRQNLEENFRQTESYVGRTIDRSTHDVIRRLSTDFLISRRDLFQSRISGGFIRDCHGDLHLEHVIILDEIMLVDCIEFNDRFRYGDTASDLAFLLMDLDFQGYPAFADRVARRYSDASGDRDILELMGFYKSYRAFVRGKVIGFTLDEDEVTASEKQIAASTAGHYFSLSLAYLEQRRPALIVMSGLTGTGKSFLAQRLGKRLGVDPLRSDVLRKDICGIPPTEHRLDKYGEGIYRTNATERTYDLLLERAGTSLAREESVILDASFISRKDRLRARELAARTKSYFLLVTCGCPDEIAVKRLNERMNTEIQPSDGRPEIFTSQKQRFDPISQDEFPYCRDWDSTGDPDPFLKAVVRELITRR